MTGRLLLAVLAASFSSASAAKAERPLADRFSEAAGVYFEGEKVGALGFLAAGVAGITAGGVLLAQDDDRAFAAGWPVLAVGLVEAGAGIFLYARTDQQLADLRANAERDAAGTVARELTRMRGVLRSFGLVEAVEVAAIGAGLAAVLAGQLTENDDAVGAGAGLAAAAAGLLALDLWADARADEFTTALSGMALSASLTRDGGLVLGAAGRF